MKLIPGKTVVVITKEIILKDTTWQEDVLLGSIGEYGGRSGEDDYPHQIEFGDVFVHCKRSEFEPMKGEL